MRSHRKSVFLSLCFFILAYNPANFSQRPAREDAAAQTSAQNVVQFTQKGRIGIRGQISGDYERLNVENRSYEGINRWSFQASPAISYFVWDNFSVGVSLAYSYFRTEHTGGLYHDHTFAYLNYGPVVSKYWGNAKLKFFTELSYRFFINYPDRKGEFSVAVGSLYFLNRGLALGPSLAYQTIFPDGSFVKKQYRVVLGVGIFSFL